MATGEPANNAITTRTIRGVQQGLAIQAIVNITNPRILPHSYAGYEDEFREFMVDAGIPVEKELAPKKDGE